MNVLYVDNFDSFAYNIVHLLAAQGARPEVMRSTDPRLRADVLSAYDALVVGPGPGNPSQIPAVVALVRSAGHMRFPVFGVCLGLQVIGEAFGAKTVRAPVPMHGKTSAITHRGGALFQGIPTPVRATRYHSLCLEPSSVPAELEPCAWSSDGVLQAVAHRDLPIAGVQFHPESVLSEHGARLVRNALGIGRD